MMEMIATRNSAKGLWALLFALGMSAVASATVTFTDLSGEVTLDLGGADNKSATAYCVVDDATLKLTGTAVNGVCTLNTQFYFPEAKTVTVDVTGVTGGLDTLYLLNGLRGAEGTFKLGAGVTKFIFGSGPGDRGNILHLPVLEAQVAFEEDAGGEVVLTNGVTLVTPPASYTVAKNTYLAAYGANVLDVDELTLDRYNLVVCRGDAIRAGCKLTVESGYKVVYRPVELVAATDASASTVSQWYGVSHITNDIDVVLNGGTLEPQLRTGACLWRGDITGSGTINLNGTGEMAFEGLMDYEGRLTGSQGFSGTTPRYTFRTAAGSTFADVAIALNADSGSGISITFVPAAGETLPVKDYSCSTVEGYPLRIGAGGHVAIDTVRTTGKSSVILGGEGGGAQLDVGRFSGNVLLGTGVRLNLAHAAVVTLAPDSSGQPYEIAGVADEKVGVVVQLAEGAAAGELAVEGKVSLAGTSAISVLRIRPGAEVEAAPVATTKVVNEGGLFTTDEAWKLKVALWLDVSAADAFCMGTDWLHEIGSSSTADSNRVFEWFDRRGYQRDYRVRSSRYDKEATSTTWNQLVLPKLVTDKADNKTYLSWDNINRTRTALAGPTYAASSCVTLPAKCVIAVFGSQLGGGCAMLSTEDARLARVALSVCTNKITATSVKAADPICLDASVAVRTNGVAVTGSTTGFNGGWQIITLTSETAFDVKGIGHAKINDSASGNGGQNYRELMVFSELPTADEIAVVEHYLAEKWGQSVAGEVPPLSAPVVLAGAGDVKLGTDGELAAGGDFAGTLDLNGHTFTVGDLKSPYRADEIPSENRILWADPGYPGAVVFSDDANKPDEVKMIYTRDNQGLVTTNGAYCLQSPYDAAGSDRRVRFVDGWLDFRDGYDESGPNGNMLYMTKLPFAQVVGYADLKGPLTVSVKAGFFVSDSSRNGGGSLMVAAANGTSGILLARGKTSPIWKLASSSDLEIATYLDATAVDGFNVGFSGGKDVLSFNVTPGANFGALSVKAHGYGGSPVEVGIVNNEILGEWILYSEKVPEEARQRIEAYLMNKWKNRLPAGFADLREATVTGAGTLKLDDPAMLPTLDADFTGTVAYTPTTLAVTFDAQGNLVGALAFPGAPLTAELTVNVDLANAQPGRYALVTAASISPDASFTLGTVQNARRRYVKLVQEAGTVYLDVLPAGTTIYLR